MKRPLLRCLVEIILKALGKVVVDPSILICRRRDATPNTPSGLLNSTSRPAVVEIMRVPVICYLGRTYEHLKVAVRQRCSLRVCPRDPVWRPTRMTIGSKQAPVQGYTRSVELIQK